MSTNTARFRAASYGALVPLVSLALALACVHHPSSTITDVCAGGDVTAHLGLVIDSVAPVGGDELEGLKGETFDIIVNLFNQLENVRCVDRSGEASVNVDDLPDELASAASGASTAYWRIDSLAVAVDMNRGVADNNLSLSLPLDGSDGHWSLSRLTGVVAQGRLITQ